MIATLKRLLPAIESWPEADQEALAEFARDIEAQRSGVYRLSDDERTAVREGLGEAARGEFAAADEVAAIFKRARG